jgi:hypothetical protein
VALTSPIKDLHMDTLRTHRRALTALSISLSAVLANLASLGCSSDGGGFGTATAGTGTTDPTGAVGGSNSNPTGAMGGNTTNPTSPMGGNTTTTGGVPTNAGSSAGGSGDVGGAAPQGGATTIGGTGNTGGTGGTGSDPACPKAGGICHEFIANDNGKNQVNYVNEFTGTKWSTAVGSTGANSPRTIEIIDNAKAAGGKAVLVSVNTGYVEIDLSNGTKLLEVKAQNTTGVTGACRLIDGTTALGVDTKIVIINASGVPSLGGFTLPVGLNLRAINRNPDGGHYWLSKTETVYDLTPSGGVNWSASMGAGTKGYAVWWRAGGGVYATTGEPATIVEIDGDKKIVATIGGRDTAALKPYNLDFFSGFVRTAKGNFIVANWLGHLGANAGKDTPMVIEFQPDGASGKVIWTWGSINTGQTTITNVFVFR